MTYTLPRRFTTLQFSQILLTLARTFIAVLLLKFCRFWKPNSIWITGQCSQGPISSDFARIMRLIQFFSQSAPNEPFYRLLNRRKRPAEAQNLRLSKL